MRLSSTFLCLATLCTSVLLLAQDRGYHTELADRMTDPSKTFQEVILTNDSQKPIEAYHVMARCSDDGNTLASVETSYDELGVDADSTWVEEPGGRRLVPQPPILAPQGRTVTISTLGPEPSGCKWSADVDAVLFADGTYGGDEAAARNLQAQRDGIVASVREWVNMLNGALGFSIDAIQAEAQRRKDKDLVGTSASSDNALSRSYWDGSGWVDANFVERAKPRNSSELPEQTCRRVVQLANKLDKKIKADNALPILDALFPLPPSLTQP
jgi:hypothetical protein